METVLVQINNNKAYKLLADLEDLHIIKVLKNTIEPQPKLSEKYAGALKLTDEQYNQFQQYITDGRNEWERDI